MINERLFLADISNGFVGCTSPILEDIAALCNTKFHHLISLKRTDKLGRLPAAATAAETVVVEVFGS